MCGQMAVHTFAFKFCTDIDTTVYSSFVLASQESNTSLLHILCKVYGCPFCIATATPRPHVLTYMGEGLIDFYDVMDVVCNDTHWYVRIVPFFMM